MDQIEYLTGLGASGWQITILTVIAVLFFSVALIKALQFLASTFGWETKSEKRFKNIEARIKTLEESAKTFNEDRIHDREQSIQIQKSLLDTIQCIKVANRVSLGDRINEKYKYYTRLQGIPEDELDEFVNLHDAYNAVGGNHGGDQKFEKAIKYRVIPMTEMIEKDL